MASSVRLFSIAGITVELHSTFLIFFAFIFLLAGWSSLLFFLLVFFFVLGHELSHSLVAKYAGITVKKITLTFIGGVASIDIPAKPRLELVMALAGPVFNFVVAGFSVACLLLLEPDPVAFILSFNALEPSFSLSYLLVQSFGINMILGVFNVLPGFPMDGGRVLRATLALKLDYLTATEISVKIGQLVVFPAIFLYGLFTGNPLAMVIAFILFWVSGAEVETVRFQTSLKGLTAQDVTCPTFSYKSGNLLMGDLLSEISAQDPFLHIIVDDEGRVKGYIDVADLSSNNWNAKNTLNSAVKTDYDVITSELKAADTIKKLAGNRLLLVCEKGKLKGIITAESLKDSINLIEAKSRVKKIL